MSNPLSVIDQNIPEDERPDLSIFSTALRVVILNISPAVSAGSHLPTKVLPFLLRRVSETYSVDDMDALISLIERFGSLFSAQQVSATQTSLIDLLQTQSGIIQKRAIIAIGHLSRYLQADMYSKLIEYVIENLKFKISSAPTSGTRSVILLSNTIAKSDVAKFKPYLSEVVPLLVSSLSLDKLDDEDAIENTEMAETREASLSHIETIVNDFGPYAITPYIEDFVKVAQAFLRYDPNFVQDEDVSEEDELFSSNNDVEMEDEDEDEDEDDSDDDASDDGSEFEDEEAFSDDDDQTWKLRRLAAKLISSLVTTSPMSLAYLYTETLRPVIVSCVKEREESVKVGSLEAFCSLVEAASSDRYYYATRQNYGHKRKSSDVSMNSADPQYMLECTMPVVVKSFLKILSNKRDKSGGGVKHCVLNALRSLNNVVRLPGDDLGAILLSISEIAVNGSPYMGAILQLVNSILVHNSTQHLLTLFQKILDIIVAGIKEESYRISGEALDTTIALFPHYSKTSTIPNTDTTSLQEVLQAKVVGTSFDIDIRKKAMLALSVLIQTISLSEPETKSLTKAICDQFDNDLLRTEILVAIRNIITPAKTSSAPVNISHISSKWAIDTQLTILEFFAQSSTSIKLESLADLRSLSRLVSERVVAKTIDASDIVSFNTFLTRFVETFQETAEKLVELTSQKTSRSQINDYQTQVSLEIQLIAECFEGLQSVSPDVITTAASISKMLLSSHHDSSVSSTSIGVGSLESALLAFFGKYTRSLPSSAIKSFYYDLVSSEKSSLTSAVAGLTIVDCGLDSEIEKFMSVIQQAATVTPSKIDVDSTIQALQIIGFTGRNKSLDTLGISLEPVYALLSSEDSDTNYIAATASLTIGKVTIGELEGYLPELLEKLAGPDDAVRKRYLYLTSLRSVVAYFQSEAENKKSEKTGSGIAELSSKFLEYVNTIWTCLLEIKFDNDKAESGEKALVAECLGRLSTIDPENLLTDLKENLSSTEVSARRSAISAIRYTLGQETDAQYDRLLRHIVIDFLVLLEDSNISIRQVALSTLMTAIRNKPILLLPHLSRLLPLLYQETFKKPELTRIVQMGPFKHEVDDGLELRKLAYEAMFDIVTSLPHEWQVNLVRDEVFTKRIFAGLSDDHDIRILSCVTLGRMVMVDIRFLTFHSGPAEEGEQEVSGNAAAGEGAGQVKNLNFLIAKFSSILSVTVNDNAVKQEFEKQSELVRNVIRVCNVIEEAVTFATEALEASAGGSAEAASNALTNLQRLAQKASTNSAAIAASNAAANGTSSSEAGSPVGTSGSTLSPSFGPSSTGASSIASGSGARADVRATVGLSDADIASWKAFYRRLKGKDA